MFDNPFIMMIIVTTLSHLFEYFLVKFNLAQKIEKTLINGKDFFKRKN